ncbi:hypothetical protein [Elizabethkingia meningoseptica]|uniref:hypothetical protein n=1 Tax=Elizabethkingia meningoseptica TaxID=238 RepID=UPI0008413A22|nr:hypothetical protein [Elizabethkingia meningoseptica]ODM51336.1 hypothetical protein BES09_17300 [Elizabethkingia meningoseptica]OHT26835.1 hypothetical protein BFF93_14845 [Elizabethkingia meningoseptica]OPC10724.1 hypothetical protein BAX93_09775 [Elizabethkingia meningoseptica]
MEYNKKKLQEYKLDDYKLVLNFATFVDAESFAKEHSGSLIEVGFTDGADNPLPDNTAKLIESRVVFKVGLPAGYEVLYSHDEKFQELAENILEAMKEKESDVAPEDWLADQNIAPDDRIIVLRDGSINTITTRERIKFLMRGNLYEVAVKLPIT